MFAMILTYYWTDELVIFGMYFEVVLQVGMMQKYSVAIVMGAGELSAIFVAL